MKRYTLVRFQASLVVAKIYIFRIFSPILRDFFEIVPTRHGVSHTVYDYFLMLYQTILHGCKCHIGSGYKAIFISNVLKIDVKLDVHQKITKPARQQVSNQA